MNDRSGRQQPSTSSATLSEDPLPEVPRDPIDVIEELSSAAEPGVVGIPSGRYFGFVIGGASRLPWQRTGEAWMSGTVWDGRAAIRLSVSNWRTTAADIDRTVAAFETALATV